MPIDSQTGKTGSVLALGGEPLDATIVDGALWVAAADVVDRLDLVTDARTTIPMPPGFRVATVAADPVSHSLWVGAAPQLIDAGGRSGSPTRR